MSSGFDFSAFIAGFQEEAEERLQAIESTLVDLEKGQMDADQLEKLRRDAHSVKGSANMLQLRDIGESAHVLEDTFAYLRDGTVVPGQTHINFMFELLDGLRNRVREADNADAPQLDPDSLRGRLENLETEETSQEGTGGPTEAAAGAEAEESSEPSAGPSLSEGSEVPLEREIPEPKPESESRSVETGGQAAADEVPFDSDLELDLPGIEEDHPGLQAGEATQTEPDTGGGMPPSTTPEPGIDVGSVKAGPETGSEASLAGIESNRLIPGLREEADPLLDRLDAILAEGESGQGATGELPAEVESVATAFEQAELSDAAEALKLVAMVLAAQAPSEVPASLRELLQGLVSRVRRRLARADQTDGRPLDRDRIRQARVLLERWGMLRGKSGSDWRAESGAAPEESAPAPGGSAEAGPAPAIGGAGNNELPAGEPPAVVTPENQAPQPSGGGLPGEAETPAAVIAEQGASELEEPPAVATGENQTRQQSARSGGAEMDVSAFLDGFQAEARENLTVIQDGLLQAEQGQISGETLDQMAQRAHTLKGSANMLGLNDLGEGSQVLEDGLGYIRSGKLGKAGIETLLGLHDALSDAADQVQEGGRPRIDTEYWQTRLQEGGQEATEAAASAPEAVPETESRPTEPATGQEVPSPEPAARQESPSQEKGGEEQAAPSEGPDKRKSASNRGTLRVSAERLERLSDGVIGLAMDRATQEDRREELDRLESQFRDLRRQWEWFENILPETGPLVEQRDKMSQQLAELTQSISQFRQETEYDISARHALYDQIHQRVMDLQVSPLSTIFSVLPRSARDLAQRFQKRVELHIEGSEIELERKNVDALLEPLVHLVTNSISHGIEDPEERKATGKAPVGHIWVAAEHVGGEVAIKVQDDGRGIDYEKIRETAIRTGVTTAAEAENMLPYDLLQILFRPGFSTKDEVSQISGRGIGMNAVRDAVQRMTGSIQVDSEVGEGTSFTLNIPVSTGVQRVLKFRVGGEIFGVLANQVERIMTLNEASLTERRGQRIFDFAGNQVPATWLSELFNLGEGPIQDTYSLRLVVVRHLEGYIGFVVNEVMEETQAVVKDVTNYLRRHAVQGLIGTTISGNGDVQLLLEPTGIKEMERTAPVTLHAVRGGGEEDPLQGLRVLLVEDSPLARQMEKAVLENSGMEVDTAVDGLDALDRMEVRFPDIVISDVEMPRMDGYDLVRKLRDDDRYRGVPVFMVTSRDSQEDRDTAQKLGADGFLNKMDLQSGNLIEEIRDRLERLYA